MNGRAKWSFMNEAKQRVQKRVVLIYQLEQSLWTAQCLSLPGCTVKGETKGEVLVSIHKEVREYLGELIRRKLPIPEETFDTAVIEIY
jgi:predicted RNase H-like HicB family nuclease